MKWYEKDEVQVGDILTVTNPTNKGRLVKVVEKAGTNKHFVVETVDGLPFNIPRTIRQRRDRYFIEGDNTKAVIHYQWLDTQKK